MNKYITFVAVVVIGIFSSAVAQTKEELIKKVMDIGKQCLTENKGSEADGQEIIEAKVPSTREGQCTLACIHEKMGLVNADGLVQEEPALKSIEPVQKLNEDLYNKMVSVVKGCSNQVQKGADKCETAKMYMECAVNKAKEVGITKSPLLM